jgi:hypothetical protein
MCSMALGAFVIGFRFLDFALTGRNRGVGGRWLRPILLGCGLILSRFPCVIGGGTQLGLPPITREPRPERTCRVADQFFPRCCGSSHRLCGTGPKSTSSAMTGITIETIGEKSPYHSSTASQDSFSRAHLYNRSQPEFMRLVPSQRTDTPSPH